jgi:hypothetical protein
LENGSAHDGISLTWKTLSTSGSTASRSADVSASLDWPAAGVCLETAAPGIFVEPALLGWPAAPSCSQPAAPGFGNGALAGVGSSGT